MNRYYLKGYCNKERHIGIDEIEKVVNNYGFIIDYKMYSDISISLTIEIEEKKVDESYRGLKNIMGIKKFKGPDSKSKKECMILFNITFTKGTGDLKIEVPNVPG